ncbi:helical bundle domain-containing protein [Legionella cincinnatiensis]|uniref:Uncharacterized protein n=1 Tax=Legionella cincinnatiensis TaxID=28085 RepID=A0A378IP65_9GAMM|nr:helical bundle domain-containing protein [Legionella cincinnatiensis]KTC87167.1 hypothetical protein Lcin_1602 [Legionella cincinnatiensis]STX36261.1 Uncharacterised protein [Legionella cincinnatiensis]
MLSSSSEYLKALREGNYLLFLEWVDFITKKYTQNDHILDADDTTNSLIFEWLTNGYSEEDAKKLALLHAVYDLESKPLQGKLDYAFKTIIVALFLCIVFHKHNLCVQSDSPKVTRRKINRLIEQCSKQLSPSLYRSSLVGVQIEFFQWVDNSNKHEVNVIFHKIHAITRLRYLLEDYILHLERSKKEQDELHTARLSLAKRFLTYIYEQLEFTPKVADEITKYVNALRELHPDKWEEEHLDALSPPSALDNTWRWVTGIGIGFFNLVLHKKSIGELISGQSETPQV